MNNKLTIAVIGCGFFAKSFVSLFRLHPYVDNVFVCDIIPERAQAYHDELGVEIIESFETALADSSINTIAIFTQRHTHGDLVIRALEAGKDVYSAVPMGISVEECKAIIETVERTGRIYMMGETCIYYPSSMYCREAYKSGELGSFVYGESQYFHDLSHFPETSLQDPAACAVPPFYYPTHSTSMILNAADSHAVRITAMGYVDREENTPFAPGRNPWGNIYSGEFALVQLANGGIARISESRRIGYRAPSSYVSSFYGTKGSYQFNNAQHLLTKLNGAGVTLEDISQYVNPTEMTQHQADTSFKQDVANHAYQSKCFAPVQQKEVEKLPEEFRNHMDLSGHMASHQFLVHEFCSSVYEGRLPYVHAWRAARFTIPGIMAHESVKQNGMPVDVPDFGDGPEKWPL